MKLLMNHRHTPLIPLVLVLGLVDAYHPSNLGYSTLKYQLPIPSSARVFGDFDASERSSDVLNDCEVPPSYSRRSSLDSEFVATLNNMTIQEVADTSLIAAPIETMDSAISKIRDKCERCFVLYKSHVKLPCPHLLEYCTKFTNPPACTTNPSVMLANFCHDNDKLVCTSCLGNGARIDVIHGLDHQYQLVQGSYSKLVLLASCKLPS